MWFALHRVVDARSSIDAKRAGPREAWQVPGKLAAVAGNRSPCPDLESSARLVGDRKAEASAERGIDECEESRDNRTIQQSGGP